MCDVVRTSDHTLAPSHYVTVLLEGNVLLILILTMKYWRKLLFRMKLQGKGRNITEINIHNLILLTLFIRSIIDQYVLKDARTILSAVDHLCEDLNTLVQF